MSKYKQRALSNEIDRFWSKVRPDIGDACWLWQGATSNGYGVFRPTGRRGTCGTIIASRYVWEINYGPVPDGLCVCHKCDVRSCVRPDHLFLGTHGDNARDRESKGRGNQPRGERQGKSKLTEAVVREIKAEISTGANLSEIARRHGVGSSAICAIKAGRSWSWVL